MRTKEKKKTKDLYECWLSVENEREDEKEERKTRKQREQA
jgi:hypothetical protein